jgi:hypothetical protein
LHHPLNIWQILTWADAHYRRTGSWPRVRTGPVHEASGLTWRRVDAALREGYHGLPRGSSLAALLANRRGVRNPARPGRRTAGQILRWADAHFARTGKWPSCNSGPIADAPGETWQSVHNALCLGLRGFAGGSTLAGLLAEKKRKRNRKQLPRLEIAEILSWAESHYRKLGVWPMATSGRVPDAPEETWKAINDALTHARRGLPGGNTLAGLVRLYRNVLLRAHHGYPLSDGFVSGGTPIEVTVRILERSRRPQKRVSNSLDQHTDSHCSLS